MAPRKSKKPDATGISKEFEDNFQTNNLYEVMGLYPHHKSSIKTADVKKAYYKCSLKYHPDRANDEAATIKFQLLGKAYAILSDDEKRAIYDETGVIDENEFMDDNKDWDQYWRLLFPKIMIEDIKNFELEYKGSEEEIEDVKKAYIKHKGNMELMLEEIPCSLIEDEERFEKLIKDLIQKEELENYPAFGSGNIFSLTFCTPLFSFLSGLSIGEVLSNSISIFINESAASKKKRGKKAEKEAKEAEEAYKEIMGKSSAHANHSDLENIIMKRQADRGSFLDDLETKYAKKGKKN